MPVVDDKWSEIVEEHKLVPCANRVILYAIILFGRGVLDNASRSRISMVVSRSSIDYNVHHMGCWQPSIFAFVTRPDRPARIEKTVLNVGNRDLRVFVERVFGKKVWDDIVKRCEEARIL